MKRFSLVTAFAVSLLSVSAESVTIEHNTAGGLEAELNAAIAANDNLTSMADITDLTIIGEAVMNATDFAAIRKNLRPSLVNLDLSGAVFTNNKLPGGDYDKEGILQTMNVVSVKLPETLTGLSGGVFFKCRKLETVNLPDGIRSINQYCFSGCEKLTLPSLPPNLTSISADAFRGCSSLVLSELPETIKTIGGDAFNEDQDAKVALAGITFSKLPRDLVSLGERAFRRTNVTFSTWPEGLTAIPGSVFSATKVQFSALSPDISSVGTYAFQSVKTMSEFTITDQANLWTKIPDGCFFVATDDVERTFICRAPSAPKATVNIGSGAWSGSFSQVAKNPNVTFKVLASAMKNYEETAPYNTMNLVRLTTTVPQPILELPEGIDASQIKVSLFVFDTDHTDFSEEVLEGEGEYKVTFTTEADSKLYVEEIRFESAAAYAEGEEDVETPVDPDLLYAADGDVSSLLKKGVNVPVVVAPGMNAVRVKVALANNVSGVENVEAATSGITRQGDIFFAAVAGIRVYDLAGRVALSSASNTIDISTLPAGAYVLQAGKSVVKIIK